MVEADQKIPLTPEQQPAQANHEAQTTAETG